MTLAIGMSAKMARMWLVAVAAASLVSGCKQSEAVKPSPSASTTNVALRYGSQYRLPLEYAQLEQAYQRRLEETAILNMKRGMAAPSSSAAFIRFIRPDEADQVMVDCLKTKGISVSLGPDGGVQFANYPAEQAPTVLAADFACQVEYPVDPIYTAPLTQEQMAVFYNYYIRQLIPCLAERGYHMDPSDVPTLSTFTATFGTKAAWSPYHLVQRRRLDREAANGGVLPADWASEWQQVNSACPQSPPLVLLFPSRRP